MKRRTVLAVLLAVLMLISTLPTAMAATSGGDERYCPGSATGHHYVVTAHKDPTCYDSGYRVYTCTYCTYSYTQYLAPLGHDWDEWFVEKVPSFTEDGVEKRICKRDASHIETRELPKLADTPDYNLALFMVQKVPEGNTFLMGELGTATVTYDVTVMNTGTKGLYFREYNIGPGDNRESLAIAQWLYPGEAYTFELVRPVDAAHIIPGSASEKHAGRIEYDYYAFGDTEDGKRACTSNTVTFAYHVDDGYTGWITPEKSELVLTKSIVNEPSNPNGFQVGETVTYRFAVTNVGVETATNIRLYDAMLFGEGAPSLDTIAALAPGESYAIQYDYTVTLEDAVAGYVANLFTAEWNDPAGTERTKSSNLVQCAVIAQDDLLLTKSVKGEPANGQYYVPGEEVHFVVSIANHTPYHFTNVSVRDPLIPADDYNHMLRHYEDIGPGETDDIEFIYIVTEADAVQGLISNLAAAECMDEFGIPALYISNSVVVPTGFDTPFGVITELTIVKAEISQPKNKAYYTVGETISYSITVTNTGETPLGEGVVYDILKVDNFGEIGTFEFLNPGDSRTYSYQYTVTAQDCGTVTNYAYVLFATAGDYLDYAESNEVVSLTGGMPPIDPPPALTPFGDAHCTRTLLITAETAELYSLSYCPDHDKVAAEVEKLVQQAEVWGNKAMQIAAWSKAQALWMQEVDELYERAMQSASPKMRAALMEDMLAQKAYLDSYAKLLKQVMPDQPVRAAQLMAEAWMNLCADLCEYFSTAPEVRANSYQYEHETTDERMEASACAHFVREVKDDAVEYVCVYCGEHASTFSDVRALTEEAKSPTALARAWTRAQAMWKIALDGITNAQYNAANSEQKPAVAAERVAFDRAVAARSTMLGLLYGSRADLAAEQVAAMVANQVVSSCELWAEE